MALVPMADLFRPPHIRRLVSDYASLDTPLTRYYGLSLGTTQGQPVPLGVEAYQYDVKDRVRDVVGYQMPRQPAVVADSTGGKMRTVPLFYQKQVIKINDDEYIRFRPPGGEFGQISPRGVEYVQRRIMDQLTRMNQTEEWLWGATLTDRVKFTRSDDGASLLPASESGSPDVSQASLRPTELTGQLPIGGTGSTPLISGSWATASTKIADDLRNIRARSISYSGFPLTEMLTGTKVANAILNNTQLREQGGTSFRVYDSMEFAAGGADAHNLASSQTANSARDVIASGQLDSMYTIVFRALGVRFRMHVIDSGVFGFGAGAGGGLTDWIETIPENMLVMTPAPGIGTWYERADGEGMIQAYDGQEPQVFSGQGQVTRRFAKPDPHHEVEFQRRYTFALLSPRAVWTPTVIYTP